MKDELFEKVRYIAGTSTIQPKFRFGTALLPALTALISTNHPEMAKTFIIVSYIAAALIGGIIGSMFAAVGRTYIWGEMKV
jgi:hypothetical protein